MQNFEIISETLVFRAIPLWIKVIALIVSAAILLFGLVQSIRLRGTPYFMFFFTLFLFGLLLTGVLTYGVINHTEVYEYVIHIKDNSDVSETMKLLDNYFDTYMITDEQNNYWTFYSIGRLKVK